ncbi:Ribonucleotide reductase of class II (coenzyme B12-dependent) [Hyphomicrobium sulfonivorans]|uniref:Vitamin B12-dependent ribonucleotide reductase n=1 Tax=Hyphomicrobium sulfonivorans TaxID=121290 RepID=A0A125NTS1_HYPSL|nr:adenosylcobalamin-dependent ribonucleoside-diphosphate reductase [Hyphomicrobium sulfonivorans]KWT64348.1 Ribonucleotide reductase of class II (coenzyme B12-dependent) [Hyphomicrobium sulfonivorans]
MSDVGDFPAPISREIWGSKYRFKDAHGAPIDGALDDTFWRVANAAAAPEKGRKARSKWASRFHSAMSDFGFLPAGRVLAGAGTGRQVTLFNCFVLGRIEDDLSAIFDGVKEAALTMQQGGGIGHDFSTLRPRGAPVASIGADASGPVSFMEVWDAMCRTIMSAGSRRGAMMATLRCDHPDIEAFIDAKSDPLKLRNFNLSVLVTDAFMAAVRADQPWDLKFAGKTYRTVSARALWERIMRSTYDFAEPGVIFIDRINARNNLHYCEQISATNPCGEQPLPPYGACLLGSINLARFVEHPFTDRARIDLKKLQQRVAVAVHFLDNIIDISNYPLAAQRDEAFAKRRIGLGITGLADALIFCGLRYGSPEAVNAAESWMSAIQNLAYAASADLAAEKGAFPLYKADAFLASPNVALLDKDVRKAIRQHGIRNGCLTSIAPTGTISLLAGNVSSGIEPVFDYRYTRRILARDGTSHEETVEDYAYARFRERFGADTPLPATFVRASDLTPGEHLAMQAALQPYVDSAISKTINCPEDIPFDNFKDVYLSAYGSGLKGCTTYRPNPITGSVLQSIQQTAAASTPSPAPGAAAAMPSAVGSPSPHSAVEEAASGTTPGATPRPAVPYLEPETSPLSSTHDFEGEGLTREIGTSALRNSTAGHEGVVYMAQPLQREPVLSGQTYKLRWPASDHAIYVTINDIEQIVPGTSQKRRRPFEIFINTRNLEHYAWTVALTRMISAVFRRGGDVSFVAEELKAVFDPQGGHWLGGRYVPSLLAAIGEVIENHMRRIGALSGSSAAPAEVRHNDTAKSAAGHAAHPAISSSERAPSRSSATPSAEQPARARIKLCPRCSDADYVQREGCWTCNRCGFSRCG